MVELLVDRFSLLAALIKEWEHAETCTLNMVFPYLIQVRKEFQGCEDDLSEQLRVTFEKLLNCYFGLSDNVQRSVEINKTFIIASFFDVRTKNFEYLDMTWRDAASKLCKNTVRNLIQERSPQRKESKSSALQKLKKGIHVSSDDHSELSRYLNYIHPNNVDIDVLTWWKDHQNDFPLYCGKSVPLSTSKLCSC